MCFPSRRPIAAAGRRALPLAAWVLVVLSGVGGLRQASGCMNDYEPNPTAIARSHTLLQELTGHATKERWSERRDRLRKQSAASDDFRLQNDLATALAHTGEAAESVTILEAIEAAHPGLYFTAANLGTAYELTGNNPKALEWIRRGIERNADAHDGTEWLHVRILEAKLALAEDPHWLDRHSILDANARLQGSLRDPASEPLAIGNRGEKLTVEQIKKALRYQLHERLQFVNAPDAVVGALLLDLADLLAREATEAGGVEDLLALGNFYLSNLPTVSGLGFRLREAEVLANHALEYHPVGSRVGEVGILATLIGVGIVIIIVLGRLAYRLAQQAGK